VWGLGTSWQQALCGRVVVIARQGLGRVVAQRMGQQRRPVGALCRSSWGTGSRPRLSGVEALWKTVPDEMGGLCALSLPERGIGPRPPRWGVGSGRSAAVQGAVEGGAGPEFLRVRQSGTESTPSSSGTVSTEPPRRDDDVGLEPVPTTTGHRALTGRRCCPDSLRNHATQSPARAMTTRDNTMLCGHDVAQSPTRAAPTTSHTLAQQKCHMPCVMTQCGRARAVATRPERHARTVTTSRAAPTMRPHSLAWQRRATQACATTRCGRVPAVATRLRTSTQARHDEIPRATMVRHTASHDEMRLHSPSDGNVAESRRGGCEAQVLCERRVHAAPTTSHTALA